MICRYIVYNFCIVFLALCDFQCLPLVYDPRYGEERCVSADILPQGITSSSWLEEPAPLFLPPATFSRMDTPQVVCFFLCFACFYKFFVFYQTHLCF